MKVMMDSLDQKRFLNRCNEPSEAVSQTLSTRPAASFEQMHFALAADRLESGPRICVNCEIENGSSAALAKSPTFTDSPTRCAWGFVPICNGLLQRVSALRASETSEICCPRTEATHLQMLVPRVPDHHPHLSAPHISSATCHQRAMPGHAWPCHAIISGLPFPCKKG